MFWVLLPASLDRIYLYSVVWSKRSTCQVAVILCYPALARAARRTVHASASLGSPSRHILNPCPYSVT